jgi:hypothetical protein
MSFKPGTSGNPGGRPKIPMAVREALEAATPKAIAFLARILDDENEKTSDRIRAAEALLDRGLGKPPQALDIGADIEGKSANIVVQFVDHVPHV